MRISLATAGLGSECPDQPQEQESLPFPSNLKRKTSVRPFRQFAIYSLKQRWCSEPGLKAEIKEKRTIWLVSLSRVCWIYVSHGPDLCKERETGRERRRDYVRFCPIILPFGV